jgi:hypothetical protein
LVKALVLNANFTKKIIFIGLNSYVLIKVEYHL